MHSPAHRINDRLRSRLKAAKLQRLTLSYFYLRAEALLLAGMVPVADNGIDYDEAGLQKLMAELGLEEKDEPPPLLDEED